MKFLAVKLLFFISYLLIFILTGCDYPTDSEADLQEDLFLILYMNGMKDGSLYLVDYPQKDCHRISFHTSVKYLTAPATKVSWTLPDGNTIYNQNSPITEPTINYFTYSKDDGSGEQIIYLKKKIKKSC